jgi:hypothetical protein
MSVIESCTGNTLPCEVSAWNPAINYSGSGDPVFKKIKINQRLCQIDDFTASQGKVQYLSTGTSNFPVQAGHAGR